MSKGRRGPLVPVKLLQKAYLDEIARGRSKAAIARDMGIKSYYKTSRRHYGPDTTYVDRMLGLKPWISAVPGYKGKRYYNKNITVRNAERIAAALNVDPREVGL